MDAAEHARLLDHDTAEACMYADPDLTGDLLLFALALARRSRDHAGGPRGGWMADVAGMVGWDPRRIRWTLAGDRPRYEPPGAPPSERRPCEGRMVRRAGPCGRPDSRHLMVLERSPVDGTQTPHYFCARHDSQATELRSRLPRRQDCPEPAANTGGVLARYFTGDWVGLYRWASPGWQPPPGWEPRVGELPVRPELRLILGGQR
jgi:hypothetical protein